MSERKYDGAACGGGDAGPVNLDERTPVGPCPGCAAPIEKGWLTHPTTKKYVRAMLHPMPFCNYYGATEPDKIEADLAARRDLS